MDIATMLRDVFGVERIARLSLNPSIADDLAALAALEADRWGECGRACEAAALAFWPAVYHANLAGDHIGDAVVAACISTCRIFWTG